MVVYIIADNEERKIIDEISMHLLSYVKATSKTSFYDAYKRDKMFTVPESYKLLLLHNVA